MSPLSKQDIEGRIKINNSLIDVHENMVHILKHRLEAIQSNSGVDLTENEYSPEPLYLMNTNGDLNTEDGINTEIQLQQGRIEMKRGNLSILTRRYEAIQAEESNDPMILDTGDTGEVNEPTINPQSINEPTHTSPAVLTIAIISSSIVLIIVLVAIYKYVTIKNRKARHPKYIDSYKSSIPSETSSKDVFRTSSLQYRPTLITGSPIVSLCPSSLTEFSML